MKHEPITTRLKFEDRADYLHVELECVALTSRDALDALGEILSEAAVRRAKKIMVKCNVSSIESDTMLLESMLFMASMRAGSRIAFVECQSPAQEHAAIGPDFKLFDDEKTAEAWLREKPHPNGDAASG
jgi:hypothetical protein